MSASAKFKQLISLLFILNISVWIVLGAKLENPDWKMWIDTDDGQLSNKRITAKSVFVAPLISKCSDGYKQDHLGRCIKIASINHSNQWQFLLNKLNSMFAPKPESSKLETLSSEPLKVDIPINNNVDNVNSTEMNKDKTKSEMQSTTNDGDFQEISTTQKHEVTTRKLPDFTNIQNSQTDFTNKQNNPTDFTNKQNNPTDFTNKNEYSTKFETIKSDWKESTRPFQESTTINEGKFETFLWITEKPKKNITQSKTVLTETMTTSIFPTTNIELNNLTTNNENLTTFFPSTELPAKQTTNQMFETNSEPFSSTMENTYPSTPFDKLTTFPLNNTLSLIEKINKNNNKSKLNDQYTTDSPFLIIVSDTNTIMNSNSNETDYILISNSSNIVNKQNISLDNNVNKISEQQVVNKINKIVDKMCIDTELCNDEIILPYFESTKTIRNNVNSLNNNTVHNETELETMNKYIKPILENSKIIQILQNNKKLNENIEHSSDQLKLNKTGSTRLDSLHDVYESLKMPTKTNIKIESSTVQSHTTNQHLPHIMQPTSKLYVSTSVYNPKKLTTTTQKIPVLTTTKRINAHSHMRPNSEDRPHFSMKPNDLIYSLQPNNEFSFQAIVTDDANFNSEPDYLFGSSSNLAGNRPASHGDFNNYDSSSIIRFPNEQTYNRQVPKQYPNSKFSIDFQNTFGSGSTDAQQGSSNSYVRFPTISRTPASTYNTDNRWSNTRWPPQQPVHQSGQYDNSWNSRWPPPVPPQQPYYNQNSRYQQNTPMKNYKLLQI